MTMLLEIKNLQVSVENKTILQGVNLAIKKGEVHAIMGPNGSGKSTLSNILAGHENYRLEGGEVLYKGENLNDLEPEIRAVKGVFLGFQYPVEVPGVSNINFLKTAFNAQRKARGEEEISAPDFLRLIREKAEALGMDDEMLKRHLNVGFSGGEKKRNEVLQLSLLEPSLAILDETDSGLDIDALKVVAKGVNALRDDERGFLLITHYHRLLEYIVPDVVHVLCEGKILRSGGVEIAKELEKTGYGQYE